MSTEPISRVVCDVVCQMNETPQGVMVLFCSRAALYSLQKSNSLFDEWLNTLRDSMQNHKLIYFKYNILNTHLVFVGSGDPRQST
jgi:hypothetical protein